MSATAPAAHVALMAPLRFSEDTPAEPGNDRLPATIACPNCYRQNTLHIHIKAETSFRASRRPVTPELVHVCQGCGTLMILAMRPALQEAVTS